MLHNYRPKRYDGGPYNLMAGSKNILSKTKELDVLLADEAKPEVSGAGPQYIPYASIPRLPRIDKMYWFRFTLKNASAIS